MSARPLPGPMRVDDLDLLISRSLDGDLSHEEERDLQRLLAADPGARRRFDAMAGVVAEVEALPEPEPSFALSVRVVANVEERSKGLASAFHRLGFFPGTGTVAVGGIFVLALALAVTLLMPNSELRLSPKGAADKVVKVAPAPDGPVEVFFQDSVPGQKAKEVKAVREAPAAAPPMVARAAPAAPSKPRPAEPVQIASAESLRRDAPNFAPEVDTRARAKTEESRVARVEGGSSETSGYADASSAASSRPAAPTIVAEAPALAGTPALRSEEREQKQLAKEKGASLGAMQAPARAAARKAASPMPVRDLDAISIVSQPGGYRIAVNPGFSGITGPFDAVYRVRVDAAGRVADLKKLSPASSPAPAGLEERLRNLVFGLPSPAPGASEIELRISLP